MAGLIPSFSRLGQGNQRFGVGGAQPQGIPYAGVIQQQAANAPTQSPRPQLNAQPLATAEGMQQAAQQNGLPQPPVGQMAQNNQPLGPSNLEVTASDLGLPWAPLNRVLAVRKRYLGLAKRASHRRSALLGVPQSPFAGPYGRLGLARLGVEKRAGVGSFLVGTGGYLGGGSVGGQAGFQSGEVVGKAGSQAALKTLGYAPKATWGGIGAGLAGGMGGAMAVAPMQNAAGADVMDKWQQYHDPEAWRQSNIQANKDWNNRSNFSKSVGAIWNPYDQIKGMRGAFAEQDQRVGMESLNNLLKGKASVTGGDLQRAGVTREQFQQMAQQHGYGLAPDMEKKFGKYFAKGPPTQDLKTQGPQDFTRNNPLLQGPQQSFGPGGPQHRFSGQAIDPVFGIRAGNRGQAQTPGAPPMGGSSGKYGPNFSGGIATPNVHTSIPNYKPPQRPAGVSKADFAMRPGPMGAAAGEGPRSAPKPPDYAKGRLAGVGTAKLGSDAAARSLATRDTCTPSQAARSLATQATAAQATAARATAAQTQATREKRAAHGPGQPPASRRPRSPFTPLETLEETTSMSKIAQLAKLAAQNNAFPQRSALGEDHGISYQHKTDDYDQGPAAWANSAQYLKHGKKAGRPVTGGGFHKKAFLTEAISALHGGLTAPEGHKWQGAGRGALKGVGADVGAGVGLPLGAAGGGILGAVGGGAASIIARLITKNKVKPETIQKLINRGVYGGAASGGLAGALGGGTAGWKLTDKLLGQPSWEQGLKSGFDKRAAAPSNTQFPAQVISHLVPLVDRREDFDPDEKAEMDRREKRLFPKLWKVDSTPIPELLASPAKQGLLGGLAGAAAGGGLGYAGAKALGGNSLLGGLAGAGVGGLLGGVETARRRYFHNAHVKEILRRLPKGSTYRDYDTEQRLLDAFTQRFKHAGDGQEKQAALEGVTEFVGKLFSARDTAHALHLKLKGLPKHTALNSFYEDLLPLVDGFVETYQGQYGLIEPPTTLRVERNADPVAYIKRLCTQVRAARAQLDDRQDTHLQNMLDEILSLGYQTIYKLVNLDCKTASDPDTKARVMRMIQQRRAQRQQAAARPAVEDMTSQLDGLGKTAGNLLERYAFREMEKQAFPGGQLLGKVFRPMASWAGGHMGSLGSKMTNWAARGASPVAGKAVGAAEQAAAKSAPGWLNGLKSFWSGGAGRQAAHAVNPEYARWAKNVGPQGVQSMERQLGQWSGHAMPPPVRTAQGWSNALKSPPSPQTMQFQSSLAANKLPAGAPTNWSGAAQKIPGAPPPHAVPGAPPMGGVGKPPAINPQGNPATYNLRRNPRMGAQNQMTSGAGEKVIQPNAAAGEYGLAGGQQPAAHAFGPKPSPQMTIGGTGQQPPMRITPQELPKPIQITPQQVGMPNAGPGTRGTTIRPLAGQQAPPAGNPMPATNPAVPRGNRPGGVAFGRLEGETGEQAAARIARGDMSHLQQRAVVNPQGHAPAAPTGPKPPAAGDVEMGAGHYQQALAQQQAVDKAMGMPGHWSSEGAAFGPSAIPKFGSDVSPFARAFLTRLHKSGFDAARIKEACDQAASRFGEAVAAELRDGLTKMAGWRQTAWQGAKSFLPKILGGAAKAEGVAAKAAPSTFGQVIGKPIMHGLGGAIAGSQAAPEGYGTEGAIAGGLAGLAGGTRGGQAFLKANPYLRRSYLGTAYGGLGGSMGDWVAENAGYDTGGAMGRWGARGGALAGLGAAINPKLTHRITRDVNQFTGSMMNPKHWFGIAGQSGRGAVTGMKGKDVIRGLSTAQRLGGKAGMVGLAGLPITAAITRHRFQQELPGIMDNQIREMTGGQMGSEELGQMLRQYGQGGGGILGRVGGWLKNLFGSHQGGPAGMPGVPGGPSAAEQHYATYGTGLQPHAGANPGWLQRLFGRNPEQRLAMEAASGQQGGAMPGGMPEARNELALQQSYGR